jgi:hypothetical protein
MNVSLTPEPKPFVDDKVESVLYNNARYDLTSSNVTARAAATTADVATSRAARS